MKLPVVATDTGFKVDVSVVGRKALLKAADDADRIHRINTTPMRDVSPEDLAWWEAEPQISLRRAVYYGLKPSLPGIAEWLRALAGGRPA